LFTGIVSRVRFKVLLFFAFDGLITMIDPVATHGSSRKKHITSPQGTGN